jgi:murein DD-endopeptidase MepM/ murein hydrolase activator NlpD
VLDVSEIRRRVRLAIERARREAAARRVAAEQAARDYERFLAEVAEPVARTVAATLKAEGYPFQLATPAGSVRVESERAREDYIEFVLDTTRTPVVVGRVSRRRGREVVTTERPVREGVDIAALTAEDVLAFLLEAIGPFVER